uniref:Odorant receptor n=1 Tax=Lutzomyia longipalpis TaxID=7200 RepID=A0A7G3AK37_LUTLO
MPLLVEEFNKVKPRIDFLIAHLTLNVNSGSRKNRVYLSFLTLCNLIFLIFVFLHLKNSKNFELNFNVLLTFLTFLAIISYGFRIIVCLRKREKFVKFLQGIKEMYEEQEEDEELGFILKKNLLNSLNFFQFCNRWGVYIFFSGGILCGVYFRLNSDYGLMYELPFNATSNMIWEDFPHVLQTFFYINLGCTIIFLDIGILFLGIQVIAEINILNDCIKLMNDKVKTQPKFLCKIIKRHCSVIENVNQLNDLISETSFMQLILTFVCLLLGITFLITYAMGVGNYIIAICGGSLGLSICILGEFIKIKTSELSNTLYLTNWYELSLNEQKNFILILGMSQREYGLKAGGMYEVNLYTFLRVNWSFNFTYIYR